MFVVTGLSLTPESSNGKKPVVSRPVVKNSNGARIGVGAPNISITFGVAIRIRSKFTALAPTISAVTASSIPTISGAMPPLSNTAVVVSSSNGSLLRPSQPTRR